MTVNPYALNTDVSRLPKTNAAGHKKADSSVHNNIEWFQYPTFINSYQNKCQQQIFKVKLYYRSNELHTH